MAGLGACFCRVLLIVRGRGAYRCLKKHQASTENRLANNASLTLVEKDEVSRKLVMLIEGECEGLGSVKAAAKHGLTRQRYFQIR